MDIVGGCHEEITTHGIDSHIVHDWNLSTIADEAVGDDSLLKAIVDHYTVGNTIGTGDDIGFVVTDDELLWRCDVGNDLCGTASGANHLEGTRLIAVITSYREIDVALTVGLHCSRVGAHHDFFLFCKTGEIDHREGVIVTIFPVQSP